MLAHLVDQRLEGKADARQFGILRLGAERIGLAVELLHQEIELAPDRPALPQQVARGFDMGVQAVDFFGHVRLYRQHGQFLRHAVRVGAIGVVENAGQVAFQRFGHFGFTCLGLFCRLFGQRCHLAQLRVQNVMQCSTLGPAHGVKSAEHIGQVRQQCRAQRHRIVLGHTLFQNAAHRRDVTGA
mgnify:CR=1 FL=1